MSNTIKNVDVFAFTQEADNAYVNYLKVVQGAVIQALTIELKIRIDEEKESILGFAITEIRQRLLSDSPEIIVPFKPDLLLTKLNILSLWQVKNINFLSLQNGMPYIISLNRRRKGWNIHPRCGPVKTWKSLKMIFICLICLCI